MRLCQFSQHKMPVLGVALVALVSGNAPALQTPGVVSQPEGQSAAEIECYWTEERMREARPAPMPHPDSVTGKLIKPQEEERPANGRRADDDDRC